MIKAKHQKRSDAAPHFLVSFQFFYYLNCQELISGELYVTEWKYKYKLWNTIRAVNGDKNLGIFNGLLFFKPLKTMALLNWSDPFYFEVIFI